jgi:membrane fusion protein, multidrug efflux system
MNENVDPAIMREVQPAGPDRPALAPPPRRRRPWLRFMVALILAAVAFFAFERSGRIAPDGDVVKNAKREGPPPQTVRAAPIVRGAMPIVIDALGAVSPLATVTVHSQVSGQLVSVGYHEGQLVKKGDFLAQIDPRPFAAALAQAQGQLAKDTALLAQAEANLARYETLNRQDSIARQQVDDQRFLVTQDKAAIQTDQAQVETAKLNLAYARIESPIDGRVGLRLVDPGNFVQPSDTAGLVVITQLQPISVVFVTPEDDIPKIRARIEAGAKLPVTAYDRANVHPLAAGELASLDNQVDTSTGAVKLRAIFANADNTLFPNQFVNARLLVDTLSDVLLAPNAAVQLGQNGPFVYVVKDGKTVEARNVKTGPSDAAHTVIDSGLADGDSVVTDGVDRLRDGAAIRLAGAKPAPEGQGGAPRRRGGKKTP